MIPKYEIHYRNLRGRGQNLIRFESKSPMPSSHSLPNRPAPTIFGATFVYHLFQSWLRPQNPPPTPLGALAHLQRRQHAKGQRFPQTHR